MEDFKLNINLELCCDRKLNTEPKKCCVCMKKDTKLLHLCLVNGGGNGLISMLCDINDSPDGNSEPTHLIICSECDTTLSKIIRFRQQASRAQQRLASIAEGRAVTQNTFVVIPPISGARNAGADDTLEYRAPPHGDPAQPLLRIVRYVLPERSAPSVPAPPRQGGTFSALQEFLDGIHIRIIN